MRILVLSYPVYQDRDAKPCSAQLADSCSTFLKIQLAESKTPAPLFLLN